MDICPPSTTATAAAAPKNRSFSIRGAAFGQCCRRSSGSERARGRKHRTKAVRHDRACSWQSASSNRAIGRRASGVSAFVFVLLAKQSSLRAQSPKVPYKARLLLQRSRSRALALSRSQPASCGCVSVRERVCAVIVFI